MKSNLEQHKFRIPLSFRKYFPVSLTRLPSFEFKLSQEKHSTSLKVHSFSSIDKFYLNQDLNYKVYMSLINISSSNLVSANECFNSIHETMELSIAFPIK